MFQNLELATEAPNSRWLFSSRNQGWTLHWIGSNWFVSWVPALGFFSVIEFNCLSVFIHSLAFTPPTLFFLGTGNKYQNYGFSELEAVVQTALMSPKCVPSFLTAHLRKLAKTPYPSFHYIEDQNVLINMTSSVYFYGSGHSAKDKNRPQEGYRSICEGRKHVHFGAFVLLDMEKMTVNI